MALRKRSFRFGVTPLVLIMIVIAACSTGEDESEPIGYSRQSDTLILSYRWSPQGGVSGAESHWVYGNHRIVSVEAPTDRTPGDKPVIAEYAVAPERHMQYYLHVMKNVGILSEREVDFGVPAHKLGSVTWHVNAQGIQRQITYQRSRKYDPRLNEKQEKARSALRYRLVGELGSAGAAPDKEYRPERTAMLVKPAGGGKDDGVARDWPLKDLSQTEPWDGNEILGNRCMIVPTEKADEITSAMKVAKKPIVWRSGGKLYHVRPHPLLPHEKDCGFVQPYFWSS